MVSKTNEQALEAAIEKALTGSSREEQAAAGDVQEPGASYGGHGYRQGLVQDFDAGYALDTARFWHFLKATQKEELAKLQKQPDWERKILQRYDRMVKKYGLLRLLKKGLEVDDAHFTLFYEPPLASSAEQVHARFARNEFSVTRQVPYHTRNLREEIDMVLFINGLPIATIELKNPWTGQRARVQGIKQYEQDRDPQQPLLQFGRCLVHFTLDTEEIFMCTHLKGRDSFFLPFNKGYQDGAGNPPREGSHRTGYFWAELLRRESLATIIQHFVLLDGKPGEPLSKRTLFFPRYHQLHVVRKLLDHARHQGVGHTYLIQHSAGSGKSNSITWAAYQLIECYPARPDLPGARGTDTPLFDTVIVVTDRRLLDKQLRDNIKEFATVKNIVAPAHSSAELREHLENNKKIIITTIQKFPFIVDGIADLSDKRFAVIIDEAHSSQSGTAAGKMNQAMGMGEEEEEEDAQDKVLRVMKARKMKGNASYLAFTATPKPATIERFGSPAADGRLEAFDRYSMKQAIEEGFILDVLANYTTYKSYYEIEKSVADNPLFDTKKAQKKLRAFVERDKRTIASKAEVMLDHFIRKVYRAKKLKGHGKGMVVTGSIESAIRYYQALQELLREQGNPFKILIAFSGKKVVDGIEYTESGINGFAESDTREVFEEQEYRLLVVANKYLTGFDEPRLCTMYVDKKLQGVLAVQALSRLNRAAPKYKKRTEDLFVLDFFNQAEDIKAAFDPFYTATTLSGTTDVGVLHELKGVLGDVGVYEWAEVEHFAEQFFAGVQGEELGGIIGIPASRFNTDLGLEDEEKADFKIKAKQFVKIYGQMAAIISFEVLAWEQLFWFLKFLIPLLEVKTKQDAEIDALLHAVDLSTYGLERTRLNYSISLDDSATELDPQNPNPRGVHEEEEQKDPLDEIIRTFNARWFEGWDTASEENKVKLIQLSERLRAHPDFAHKYADNPDQQNRNLALQKMLQEVLARQRMQDLELYKLHAKDDHFKQGLFELMKRLVDGGRGAERGGV